MRPLGPVEAAGWEARIVADAAGREILRVWWLGWHVGDCRTVVEVLRLVPVAVLREVVNGLDSAGSGGSR